MEEPEDIPIPLEWLKKKRSQKMLMIIVALELVFFFGFSFWLWTSTRGPSVPISSLRLGKVTQGTLPILIESKGILLPRNEQLITSSVDGVVEHLFIYPGKIVKDDQPLLTLRNTSILNELQNAELTLAQDKAQVTKQQNQFEDQLYSLKEDLAEAKEALENAKMRTEAENRLAKDEVISELQYKSSELKTKEDRSLVDAIQGRISALRKSEAAQMKGEGSLLASARDVVSEAKQNVEYLEPKADQKSEVQKVYIQTGQSVHAGSKIARIASAHQYDAVLYVQQAQIGHVKVGQTADIKSQTNSSVATGRIIRISPVVKRGRVSITVRIQQNSQLHGARPYLPITGIIHAGFIKHAIFVAPPITVTPNSRGYVYVLNITDRKAVRIPVRYGTTSAAGTQIISGLNPTETVVISSTKSWNPEMRLEK